jgi:flavodoxin
MNNKSKYFFSVIVVYLFISISAVYGQYNQLSGMKAILIVGDQQEGTSSAIAEMNELASLFTQNGIYVYKFYDENTDWEKIINVSRDCSFFVYSGHGSNQGIGGAVGGLALNEMISTNKLMSTLRLKNNAMVLFKSVCNGAGSSAGDDEDIQISEAKNRVTNYSYPFFAVGASAYYANNFQKGVYNFLNDFLSGLNLKQAYINSAKTWSNIEIDETFSRDAAKTISIASTNWGGVSTRTTYTNGVRRVETVPTPKQYDIAFVGNKNFSILNMK